MTQSIEPGAKVCVIGAGIAGLVTAKTLAADGFDVTVYEKESSLGGTWNANRTYPGLRANNSKFTYCYSDHPYPKDAATFPYAEQIRGYLESYANRFNIRKDIRFNTRITNISRTANLKKLKVSFFGSPANDEHTEEYDFVAVCNGVFHEPNVPVIPGMDEFEGEIVPACNVTQKTYDKSKYPIVAGGGKTALDCTSWAAKLDLNPHLVMRHPHWIAPRYVFGLIPTDLLLVNRFSGSLLRYHRFRGLEEWLHAYCSPLIRLWWKMVSKVFMTVTRMPAEMTPPNLPVELERAGVGAEFFSQLRDKKALLTIGEIKKFHPDHVELRDGSAIPADLVIFATGWKQNTEFIDPALRKEIVDDSGKFHLYRQILPPTIPNLGFVGYGSSFAAQMTAEVGAHWLSECFLNGLSLPSAHDMRSEIARVHQWAEVVMPSRREGYFVGAYMTNYINDLVEDMGLPVDRTRNFLQEQFGPCFASRYATLGEERRQLRQSNNRTGHTKFYFSALHAAGVIGLALAFYLW